MKNKKKISRVKKFEKKNNYEFIVNSKIGKNFKFVEPINLYNCKIGDNVFVGPFVEIQKGVNIMENSRISSHSFLCELVSVGKNCFIGHGVMFVNDLFKSGKTGGNSKNWLKTIIENNVLIGSNSTILPVKIKKGCVIGAGSVVTKDCNIKGIYAGNPAKLIRKL
jgi:acetyltransferase-like isoleucine patch superfamily enzyme